MDSKPAPAAVVRRPRLTPAQLAELAQFVAECNSQPRQHIGYLGEDLDTVAAELAELDGDTLFAVARDGERLVGLLYADWDLDLGRTWLHGPWAPEFWLPAADSAAQRMDRLYQELLAHLPAGAEEHELFCDVANTAVVDFAGRHGFAPHGQHEIMRFRREQLPELPPVRLPALQPPWQAQFAELHDRAFPGTYAPSRTLLADQPTILVEADGDTLLGYVVLKLQPDYPDAQIAYLAVAPPARGRGVGARLVAAALHETFRDDRFQVMDLVVDNPVARRLYQRVGFRLLRKMRSFRTARPLAPR